VCFPIIQTIVLLSFVARISVRVGMGIGFITEFRMSPMVLKKNRPAYYLGSHSYKAPMCMESIRSVSLLLLAGEG